MPDREVAVLVRASAAGDETAWNELVRRFAPMVVAIARHYRLPDGDRQDVCQTVWLRLVEHLSDIREPAAVAGWIASTTRHECVRSLRHADRTVPVDPINGWQLERPDGSAADAGLLLAERHDVVRRALAELPEHQRELLLLLAADPPLSYAEVGRILGIPVGSIGPTRARCLNQLSANPAIRALSPS
jgi:RNA polymerase sigma factor (sigma-70 family)